jgi:di/tricarboxylate transporter
VLIAGILPISAFLGLFISNTATAALMAPIALAVAETMDASPRPFAMTVMLAASAASMTPVSSPVNTLVTDPGNDTFFDFGRIGAPVTLVALVVTVTLVPWILPSWRPMPSRTPWSRSQQARLDRMREQRKRERGLPLPRSRENTA